MENRRALSALVFAAVLIPFAANSFGASFFKGAPESLPISLVPPAQIVSQYRDLRKGHGELDQLISPYNIDNVRTPQSLENAETIIEIMQEIRTEMRPIEAKYPDIGYHSASPVGRVWMTLTGQETVVPHVAHYRSLDLRRKRLESSLDPESNQNLLRRIRAETETVRQWREELEEIQSELESLRSADPNVEYRAAGLGRRAWLNLTGRGLKP